MVQVLVGSRIASGLVGNRMRLHDGEGIGAVTAHQVQRPSPLPVSTRCGVPTSGGAHAEGSTPAT